MEEKIPRTGINGNFTPAPRWDGTPVPEFEEFIEACRFLRRHGDPDGSVEQLIYDEVLKKARQMIFSHVFASSSWREDLARDVACAGMMAIVSSWDHRRGVSRFLDQVFTNFYYSWIRDLKRRQVPQAGQDDEMLLNEVIAVEVEERIIPEWLQGKMDALLPYLTKLEIEIMSQYNGDMIEQERKTGISRKRIDNAMQRVRRKALGLGLIGGEHGKA